MFQIVILTTLLQNIVAQTKLNLLGSNPQYMNCQKINENYNGFFGPQFFYDELSQSNTLTNLDKITFEMWFWVHSKMILKGKQILFSFVNGNSNSPYLNLMLYYYVDRNSYYLNLLNENIAPEVVSLKLDQINDLYKESWNHVLLSIDQSSPNTFINLKFFSTYNYQLQQIQETLISQRLKYEFGPQSRITNEQLFGITKDYKACVNIVNFNYINDWTTMDSEIYFDTDMQQVFSLKPFALTGLAVNQIYDQIFTQIISN